ncbi:MAG: aminoacyl-tRNA hydrolase, partial [Bacteroidetes bacterium]|nr:aminoacyl-tRNA hydrolase [Bacteroidota bacterium]
LEARPLPFENVLVVVDDVALPLGTVRIRPGGSDGGHNGLVSVIEHLRSDQFPRLRCGIGEPPPLQSMEEFVLSPFDTSEKTVVREMIARAADAVMEFVSSGIAPAMNEFNA